MASGKHALPEALAQSVTTYWEGFGRELKDQRDLSQHHVVLASEGRAALSASGELLLFLVLPSNAGAAANLDEAPRYQEPFQHSYPWMLRQFEELLLFVYAVTYELIDPIRPLSRLMFTSGKPALKLPGMEGFRLAATEDLGEHLDSMLATLKSQSPLPKSNARNGAA